MCLEKKVALYIMEEFELSERICDTWWPYHI